MASISQDQTSKNPKALPLIPRILDVLENPLPMLAELTRDGITALQEPPRATAIFRRCCALPADANRIGPPRFGGQVAFDPDLVPPGIAEVILVEELFVAAKLEAVEPDRMGVVRKR